MQTSTEASTYANELEMYKQRYLQLKTRNNELENTIKTVQTNYEQRTIELIEYQNKYLEIKERYDLLIYKRFMRSAERLPEEDKQGLLFTPEVEPVEIAEREEKEERIEVKSYSRTKCGRKPIDPRIPRDIIIIDIPEEEKTCVCGTPLTKIGEEISEKVEIIPQTIRVTQIQRPKYVCRGCEGVETEGEQPTVRIAPVEPTIIPKSIASPSLLSTVFTHKFEDHLPYYRQERQFERIGVDISRQDMSNWQQQVYNRLTPLFEIMKETVKSGPVMNMDETSMQVMSGIKTKKEEKAAGPPEERKPDIHTGWMWVALGGPPGKKVVWYAYHESRGGAYVKEFLKGYKGYLQTDGWDSYDSALRGNPDIIHAGCFAHARRKFFEAFKASENSKSASEGIKHIRHLYDLEDKLRSEKLNEEEFVRKRKEGASPILEQFKTWLLKRSEDLLTSGLLGAAVHYSLNQWNKMTAYLGSYHLTPDNNACENAIRPFVIGRKNWLISGSPQGAKSSCGIYSLIESAKQNGIVPFYYLMALFEKAPFAVSTEDWEKLLPWNIFKD